MKKYILTFFVFYFLNSLLMGQVLGNAICLKYDKSTLLKSENELFYNEMIKSINETGLNYILYDWNGDVISYNPILKNDEIPVESAIFIEQKVISNQLRPSIKFTLTNTGVISSAMIKPKFNVMYDTAILGVSTGVLKSTEKIYLSNTASNIVIRDPIYVDIKKYYDSKKLSSFSKKQIEAIENKIYKDYKSAIDAEFRFLKKDRISKIRSLVYSFHQLLDYHIYEVKVNETEGDFVKEITIICSDTSGFKKGGDFYIYAILEKYGKKIPIKVINANIKKVSSNEITCGKQFLTTKKKFSRLMLENKNLFAVRNVNAIKYIEENLIDGVTKISINIKDSLTRSTFKQELVKNVSVLVIEKSLEKESEKLRSLYNKEEFIDFKIEEVQSKRIGAQFIFSKEGHIITLTDVSSGKLFSLDETKGKSGWMKTKYASRESINLILLKANSKRIELLEIEKEDAIKGKVIYLPVYHPYGFRDGEQMDVFTTITETLAGKEFIRKEFLGNGFISSRKKAPKLGKLVINKKYRKAIYTALQNNEKLSFSYSIKRK